MQPRQVSARSSSRFDAPPLPKIKGFDRQGEPELRDDENGALELVFNFMPPQVEPIVMGASVEELMARAKAW